MSVKSIVKQGLNVKAIGGVVLGIVLFNVLKTKIPAISERSKYERSINNGTNELGSKYHFCKNFKT